MPPREKAVVEGGSGVQDAGGVGRHDGGREGGGVVREEVSRGRATAAVNGAVDGVTARDVPGEAREEAGGVGREGAGGLRGEQRRTRWPLARAPA